MIAGANIKKNYESNKGLFINDVITPGGGISQKMTNDDMMTRRGGVKYDKDIST